MTRRFTGTRILVASHNAGKVREISELLAPFSIETVPAADLGLAEPDETADSFAGNAVQKALAAARTMNSPALADDSGLSVDSLDGQPGIFSARWAGPSRDFNVAMRKVNAALLEREATRQSPVSRKAKFVCALCLAWPDDHVEVVEGDVRGSLTWPPRGDRGFGYDPIFVPDGLSETFGEIDPAVKARISHRAMAFQRLLALILTDP